MALPVYETDAPNLIAGAYEVLVDQALPEAGGGLAAFRVSDHRQARGKLMAVRAEPAAPARALALGALGDLAVNGMVAPIAHGVFRASGAEALYVVCLEPEGRPLLAQDGPGLRPWSEREIMDHVLRPAALALDRIAGLGVTHRAIRPNNVFQIRPGLAVTLGCAWAGPPASGQPAVFEPPAVAMCHPAGRGDGTIADDVYALGVLLITLAGGRMPLKGLDDETVIRRKLELGCFAALCGDVRLPSGIAELARGMLAEDPDHRPLPVLLADPAAARGRRVTARPPQRAQRPLAVGAFSVRDVRSLAFALARSGGQAARMLKGRDIGDWLRRALGEPGAASRIEEAVLTHGQTAGSRSGAADAVLVMQSVAILDPLAPLCWRSLSLFPDGLGPLLAHADAKPADWGTKAALPAALEGVRETLADVLDELVHADASVLWGEARPERADLAGLRLDGRQHRLLLRIAGWAGGPPRLRYALNPLLACRSPLLGSACVTRLAELLPALERQAEASGTVLIDREIAGFVSARSRERQDADFAILAQADDVQIDPPGHRALAQLRILAKLAAGHAEQRWTQLSAQLLPLLTPALGQWRSRSARARAAAGLSAAASEGHLAGMLLVFSDGSARKTDREAGHAAEAELSFIGNRLQGLLEGRVARAAQARALGQEVATAVGMIAFAASAVVAAL